ncbi:MAG TPA: hypothetical protein PLF13_10855 [candidate division Zixibacteria bacterium]|nr:hypothetical protein [candidate division Zixibacteria bacterium]
MGAKLKRTLLSAGWFLSAVLMVVLLRPCCHYPRITIASAFDEHSHVVAWLQDSNATLPGVIEIAYVKSGDENCGLHTFLRVVNRGSKVALWLLEGGITFAKVYYPDYYANYRSDYYPNYWGRSADFFIVDKGDEVKPFEAWEPSSLPNPYTDTLSQQSSSLYTAILVQYDDRDDVRRLSFGSMDNPLLREIVFIGVSDLEWSFASDTVLHVNAKFLSGAEISDGRFTLPGDPSPPALLMFETNDQTITIW